jgi:hypothetical protein
MQASRAPPTAGATTVSTTTGKNEIAKATSTFGKSPRPAQKIRKRRDRDLRHPLARPREAD